MHARLLFLLVLAFAGSCRHHEDQQMTMDPGAIRACYLEETDSGEKIVIYQMMTRLFGNKKTNNVPYGTLEENGVGKFSDINDAALKELRELGTTHIWYTGVIEHAVLRDYTEYGIFSDDADVVKGRAGSPYAIKDYYDVNPDLATDVGNRGAEFDQLVRRTHDHDMKVIIDFVPNHVARQYRSDRKPDGTGDLGEDDDKTTGFDRNNNFYYLPGEAFKVPEGYDPLGPDHRHPAEDGHFEEIPAKVSGNDVFRAQPDINDWFETVKLNYGVDYQDGKKTYFDPIPDTWHKMRDILIFWTSRKVDGFRCDMAEMVPVEFWAWVIPQVKQINPEILFIAEIYNPASYKAYLDTARFDYLYDKVQLYDTLKQIIRGQGVAGHISTVRTDLAGINSRMLRFLENHDEQRIASPYFAGDPFHALPAMTVSALLASGPVMIYFGQESGEKGEGFSGFGHDDGRTTIYDYWGVPAHQQWMNGGKFDGAGLDEEQKKLRGFYRDILRISRDQSAIRSAHSFDLHLFNWLAGDPLPDPVYAFLRFSDEQTLLVLVNFSPQQAFEGKLIVPHQIEDHRILPDQADIRLSDLLSASLIEVTTEKNFSRIPFQAPPLASQVYVIKN